MFFKNWLWCFTIFFLFFSTTAVHAQIPLPARIGGAVTVDGTLLTQANATGYTFLITKQTGTPYSPTAEDVDGLNASDWYLIDIPIYDAAHQPGGANPGDTAVIHVYKNGTEITVTSPDNGKFTVGAEGSTTQMDFVTVTSASVVTLDPTSLAFGSQAVGTTSAAKTVTLTNSGNATLNITSITGSGDFAVNNTCGVSLAAGADCSISITFSPTVAGNRTGQITVATDAASSPNTVALSGTGATDIFIPTVNEWGMIILPLLMAGSALWIMRKKGFER